MDFPNLHFPEGGWCEALKTSYAPGAYRPKTKAEYEALAPFAVDAPALEPEEPKEPKPLEDMKAGELVAYAEANGLDIGGLVAQSGKEKILTALKEAIAKKEQV